MICAVNIDHTPLSETSTSRSGGSFLLLANIPLQYGHEQTGVTKLFRNGVSKLAWNIYSIL
jgi:hypothetical protein